MACVQRSFFLDCLGCPKNEVDSDYLVSALLREGWSQLDTQEGAGVIVINTCSFIVPAVEESIEAIMEMGELSVQGDRRLVVTGCLVARYGKDKLSALLPEVDLFVDFAEYPYFATMLEAMLNGGGRSEGKLFFRDHASTLSRGYVYIKIAEGCGRKCTFCSIPAIRGPLRSRPWEEIRDEARLFLARGARELILIAQDTTSYGLDIYGRRSLSLLTDRLCEEDGDWKMRIMYTHPEGVDDEVLRAMSHPRVQGYLDLPFQHVDERILRAMGRKGSADSHRSLLERIRGTGDDIAVRATFIVGFPGEDQAAFESLYDFIAEMRFDWIGLFSYSQEERTVAFSLGRGVGAAVTRRRIEEISALQEEIMRDRAAEMVGRKLEVLVEERSLEAPGFWEARSYREAPDIDGVIFIPHNGDIRPGSIYKARIVATEGIDLVGSLEAQ